MVNSKYCLPMDQYFEVILKMTKLEVKECTHGQMVEYMRVNGREINLMDKEFINLLMVLFMMEHGEMEFDMDTESRHNPMERLMKESSKRGNSTVLEW